MKIEDIANNYKEYAELQRFAESQLKLINSLSCKVTELEEERNHLRGLLTHSLPLIENSTEIVSGAENSEQICTMQLKLLKDKSISSELTMEETKKTEIYTKILQSLKEKDKKAKNDTKELSDEDLLAAIENDK